MDDCVREHRCWVEGLNPEARTAFRLLLQRIRKASGKGPWCGCGFSSRLFRRLLWLSGFSREGEEPILLLSRIAPKID